MVECSFVCKSSRIQGYAIFRELHMIQVLDTMSAYFEARLAAKNISGNLRNKREQAKD